MIRRTLIALSAVAAMFGATACNTVKGAGQDIESVGEAGSDAIK